MDDAQVFGFADVGVADVHQLHHFAFGDDVGGVGHHFEDFHAARADHELKGAGVQEVAHQNGGGVAKQVVGGFAPAPHVAFVHHVIVQQGGGVDEFHHCGKGVERVAVVAQRFAGQNGDDRPQPLAARADDIAADLRNQGDFRLHRPPDHLVDAAQVGCEVFLEIGQVFKHRALKTAEADRLAGRVSEKGAIIATKAV